MNFKMVKTTNQKFEYLLGRVGNLSIGLIVAIDYFGYRESWFHTSRIQTIKYEYELNDDNHVNRVLLYVTTKNSNYVFESVYDDSDRL